MATNNDSRIDRRTLLTRAAIAGGATAIPAVLGSARTSQAAAVASAAGLTDATQFFEDPQLNSQAIQVLGAVSYNAACLGEVLTVFNEIHARGDSYLAFYDAFLARAKDLRSRADSYRRGGHKVSAREAYLRAASYFDQALYFVYASSTPTRKHESEIYREMDGCWRAAAELFSPHFEYVEIPYGKTKLSGWLLSPGGSKPRPTIILNTGSDGQNIDLFAYCGQAALERGWNAFIYAGPGQGSSLYLKGMPFIVKWEKVIARVIDVLVERPEVSRSRIVLGGWAFSGLIRAAAYDSRIAALVSDPGVVNDFVTWQQALGPELVALLDSGDKTAFNDAWSQVFPSLPPEQQSTITKRSEIFGQGSFYDRMHLAQQFQVGPLVISKIKIPTLVIGTEKDQFGAGQAQQLFSQLKTRTKKLLSFTVSQGAQFQFEPMAPQLRNELMFNWLEDKLS